MDYHRGLIDWLDGEIIRMNDKIVNSYQDNRLPNYRVALVAERDTLQRIKAKCIEIRRYQEAAEK